MKQIRGRARRFCRGAVRVNNTEADHRRSEFYSLISIISLCLIVLTGCQNEQPQSRSQFDKDTAAVAQLRRISATLAQVQRTSEQDMAVLKELHNKYPDATPVRQTLQSALVVWKDWDGVVQLIAAVPEAERTRQEKITLVQAYLIVGRYHEAANVAGPLAEASPSDLEANSLAGRAWYYEGRYDDAARAFDRVWNSLVTTQRAEDITLRGLIYFYQGNHQKAIETLKVAFTFQPDYYPGYAALSRVYRALGDERQAEEYQKQGTESFARQSSQRAKLSRVASKLRELELAWNEHRYEDVVRITQSVLQDDAGSGQRQVLYQYLAQAYQALGRTAEAQAALSEAARLASNKGKQ